jgi:hypothetical protein
MHSSIRSVEQSWQWLESDRGEKNTAISRGFA